MDNTYAVEFYSTMAQTSVSLIAYAIGLFVLVSIISLIAFKRMEH